MEKTVISEEGVLDCVLYDRDILKEDSSWIFRDRKLRSYNITQWWISPILANAKISEEGKRYVENDFDVNMEGYDKPGTLTVSSVVEREGKSPNLLNLIIHERSFESGPFNVKYNGDCLLLKAPEFPVKYFEYHEKKGKIYPFYHLDFSTLKEENQVMYSFVQLLQLIRKRCLDQVMDKSCVEKVLSRGPAVRILSPNTQSIYVDGIDDGIIDFDDLKTFPDKMCKLTIYPFQHKQKTVGFRIWEMRVTI